VERPLQRLARGRWCLLLVLTLPYVLGVEEI
jgi:hypothetical protein